MTAVKRVAIAGAGLTGLAAAIQLAKAGVEVDVFERRAALAAKGSGISLQGNALRAFDQLGVWEQVRDAGYSYNGLKLRAPGPDAPIVADLPEVATGGPDYPAGLGMLRPDLARIVHDHAVASGVAVHFGQEVTAVSQAEGLQVVAVDVNGEARGDYDLVIGADGLNSSVRSLIGIETAPERTGMGIWRGIVSRPAEVQSTELYYGGPLYIAGYTPTGENSMYVLLVEAVQDRSGVGDDEAVSIMHEATRAYGGPWEQVRADLERGEGIHPNYTAFTQHLIEGSWNRGRVVVIGDAAHSCPPTIAQGAAQGLEDAVVLAELLVAADDGAVDDALWTAFHERRVPRAKAVVDASVQLGQWQLDGDREADSGGLIFGIAKQMAVPA
ncbi:MAG: FAD-dependent monooxygenase [Pseudoclavibacter sp.]